MRIELIHPLIVHFPIALLLIGSAFRLLHFFLRKNQFEKVSLWISWILLFLGVCSAWLAIIAGEIAGDIVSHSLCKPDILEHHQDFAYTTAILYSSALLVDWGKHWIKNPSFRIFIILVVSLTYCISAIFLILTGGFGADLVFKQGAAVERVCD